MFNQVKGLKRRTEGEEISPVRSSLLSCPRVPGYPSWLPALWISNLCHQLPQFHKLVPCNKSFNRYLLLVLLYLIEPLLIQSIHFFPATKGQFYQFSYLENFLLPSALAIYLTFSGSLSDGCPGKHLPISILLWRFLVSYKSFHLSFLKTTLLILNIVA